jgi:putative NADPH-quinone reductase
MSKRIAIIDGHPDPAHERFCHVLATTYAEAAKAAGHQVRRLTVAELDVPVLRSAKDWAKDAPTPDVQRAQETITWAEHLVIVYPLWLGSMPALLKAFFEQVFRPGFAIKEDKGKGWPVGLFAGKSARVVVTMGMPALIYRLFFLSHSLKSLERNILRFSGIKPIRESLIGSVESSAAHREKWLQEMRVLGHEGR